MHFAPMFNQHEKKFTNCSALNNALVLYSYFVDNLKNLKKKKTQTDGFIMIL